ncbi:L,D-transpeptidase [Streptomyces sp. NPDC013953]|uniref:L,D-transpeptidase n=1 Tax=Streptomyces sp. NPDC013953 TaxID=3364868 RepID=UPI0036F99C12
MSDELTTALRALAEERQPSPAVPGAGIRRLAVRRRRRRHALITSGLVAACLAVVVPLGMRDGTASPHVGEQPPSPSATAAATTAPTPEAAATVDLSRRVLTAAGRQLPISSGDARHRTPVGAMTVSAKHAEQRMTGDDVGFSGQYDMVLPWVIELRAAGGATNHLAAIPYDDRAPGMRDVTTGWIALRPSDAAWLYQNLGTGDVVTVTGTAPAP